MAKKSKKKDKNEVLLKHGEDEDFDTTIARAILRPSLQAAATIKDYSNVERELNLPSLFNALSEQVRAVNDGDMTGAEAMLTAQAHTLDCIFNNLAQRAIHSEYTSDVDTYLKLALRAQSQSRGTWEALSAIKHPTMANYVAQANISQGPQQVNNNASRMRGNENPKSELLEKQDGSEWMDAGKAGKAGRVDKQLEAVGAVHRSEDGRGKSQIQPERL